MLASFRLQCAGPSPVVLFPHCVPKRGVGGPGVLRWEIPPFAPAQASGALC